MDVHQRKSCSFFRRCHPLFATHKVAMQPCLDHFSIEESGVAETPAKVLPVTLFLFALGWIGAAHLVG